MKKIKIKITVPQTSFSKFQIFGLSRDSLLKLKGGAGEDPTIWQ